MSLLIAPVLPADNPDDPTRDAARAFERIAACVPGCLSVGAEAATRGNLRLAAEYVLGALEDLAPELDTLRRLLRSPGPQS